MLAVYVRFDVTGDGETFVSGFGPLAAEARRSAGCVGYDLLVDPLDSTRGAIVELWETEADRETYLLTPCHVEMVALATSEWGMGNFKTYYFRDAGEPVVTGRARSETPAAGRDEMNRRVLDRLGQRGTPDG